MTVSEVLSDAFSRIEQLVTSTVTGLSAEDLSYRPKAEANSIGWLIWHLTRIQDDHVADAAGSEQLWTAAGWHDRFGLPFDATDTGYRHGPEQVSAVQISQPELLIGYHDAVYQHTASFVARLTEADLARVVDEGWNPPVTLGVRLVSVLGDAWQHVGQAAYLKGLLD
ncbi:MAG: mycothiol transferase [Jatrophihabitantaceae bacterium]